MDNIYKRYVPPSNNGGQYLKFEDSVPVKLRIASDPLVFSSTFTKGEKTQVSMRYGWVVWNFNEDVAQVMVLPTTPFISVRDLSVDDDWGDPTKYDLKITRSGVALKTRYTVNPVVAKEALTTDQENQIKGINLKKALEASPNVSAALTLDEAETSGHKFSAPAQADKVYDDIDVDEPINLDDIPF